MNPPPASEYDQALERTWACAEDWEDCRADAHAAPGAARAFLAAWGALCRVADPGTLPPAIEAQVGPELLAACARAPLTVEWLEQARHLERAWEYATDPGTLRELEGAAVQLFDQLDQDGLAACVARRLSGTDTPGWLAGWTGQVELHEAFFAAHADSFLPAAALAVATLNACRPDLDRDDPNLWRTTLKHRRLEEAFEEAESDASTPTLSEQDRQTLLARSKSSPLVLRLTGSGLSRAYSRRVLPPRPPLAAADSRQPEVTTKLTWRAPNTGSTGSALFSQGWHVVRLNLYGVDGQPAAGMEGKQVKLAGVERVLDARARAEFTLRELDEAGQDLTLEVAGEPWPASPDA